MEAKCKKCGETFKSSEIFVTYDGLFCKSCLPVDVIKKFISLDISWDGINALVDYYEGDPTVEQLMIVDKMMKKIKEKMVKLINDCIQESDS